MICSRSVDIVERWSERIAQRVAPAEIDFAADVGVAYAAGGRARKDLLPRPGMQPGAFGPGIYVLELPLILRALADAGNALLSLLGGPYLSNVLAAGGLFAALRAGHGDRHAPVPEQSAARTATGPEPPPALPAGERQAAELAFKSLRGRLTAAGFTEKRAGQLAYELLEELLTDAAEAAVFVDALTAVPDDGARPGLRRKANEPQGAVDLTASGAAESRRRSQGLGGETTAQADSHHRQPYQGDHRAGHRPERNTGHGASAQGAHALEREDDPCHRDEQAHADEQNLLHDDYLFPGSAVCGRLHAVIFDTARRPEKIGAETGIPGRMDADHA
jgi:hypothetical protein